MESCNYYSEKALRLSDIEQIAITNGYEYGYYADDISTDLHIKLDGTWEKRITWQEYIGDDYPEDETIERRAKLNTVSSLIFLYRKPWMPYAVSFLRLVLKEYGGFFDCDGDALELYNLENLDAMIEKCPC